MSKEYLQAESSDKATRHRQFLLLGTLGQGGLAVVAALIAAFISPNPLAGLGASWRDIWLGVLISLPLFGGFIYFWQARASHWRRIRELLDAVLVPMIRSAAYWHLALVSALAGFGEELLFRGIIQAELAERVPAWLALLVASLCFGLAHSITRAYIIVTFAIGLLLGALVLITDSLVLVMIIHAVYDFLALSYVKFMTSRQDPATPSAAS